MLPVQTPHEKGYHRLRAVRAPLLPRLPRRGKGDRGIFRGKARRMKIRHAAVIAWGICLSWGMWAIAVPQDRVTKDYTLTETQTLRLKVKQLEYSSAFEHYQQAVNAFNAEVKAVEKEHDWPETMQFDPNTLTFHAPPESPKPVEKPEAKEGK
jgi:hypothetical protein